MMVWDPNISANSRGNGDVGAKDGGRQIKGEEQGIPSVQYLLNAVVDVVARLGVRSVAVTLAVALLVAAILTGLSVDEASAVANWCPGCR